MIVLIDLGNSRVKLGWLDPATGARETTPIALNHGDTALQIGPWLSQLPGLPAQAIGVSVGSPDIARRIEDALRAHGCAVRWQQATACALGLKNGYVRPEQLGADRWVAMLGLLAHLPDPFDPPDSLDSAKPPTQHGPIMLASFGTATTLDTIGPDRVFMGGLILPGPALMLESLARNTAHLPLANSTAVAYPSDTQQAIASGVAAAQAGAVVRQWLIGLDQYGAAPALHVTGGGWPLVAAEVRRLLDHAAHLRGLPRCLIHERNRPVLDGLAALAMLSSQRATH